MKPQPETQDQQVVQVLQEALLQVPERNSRSENAGRAQFLTEAAQLSKKDSNNGFLAVVVLWLNSFERPRKLSYASVASLAVIVASFTLLFGGVGVVSASQDALPGERLYPVKILSEEVQLLTSLEAGNDLLLHLEFAGERLREMQFLVDEREGERYKVAEDGYDRHHDAALGLMGALGIEVEEPKRVTPEVSPTLSTPVETEKSPEETLEPTEESEIRPMVPPEETPGGRIESGDDDDDDDDDDGDDGDDDNGGSGEEGSGGDDGDDDDDDDGGDDGGDDDDDDDN
ncbi:MAG: hypothetical protein DWQ07_22560 [Chloroflexi bacterium]|nr:MAG: hypothetical protein DWQ07_22560 [Chloroflexota bacterium]MBL1193931.1 hypothetical protein [Chloroflexota bacterium]NOH11225.1 hypothetical protein [Chloroflexota bacterium]